MPRRKSVVEMTLDLCQTGAAVEHHQNRILFVFELKVLE